MQPMQDELVLHEGGGGERWKMGGVPTGGGPPRGAPGGGGPIRGWPPLDWGPWGGLGAFFWERGPGGGRPCLPPKGHNRYKIIIICATR